MSDGSLEWKINMKFLVKLEKNATEYHKILQQVYGKGTISRLHILQKIAAELYRETMN
jgi:hypothetical protein